MKKFIAISLFALLFTACDDGNVKKIKEGFLELDKSVSIGYVLDSYKDCGDLSWSSQAKDGKDFVVAKCNVSKVAKAELSRYYEHFLNNNYLVNVGFLKPFVDNIDFFKDLWQDFYFIINKDGSYALYNITINALLENGKEVVLNANDKNAFMRLIYRDETLTEPNDTGIANYIVHLQNIIENASEFKDKFGLNAQNSLPENERINATKPFGFTIKQSTISEIFTQIPCYFEESKFIGDVFEKNGYYITYKKCSLAENMESLEFGFDDEQKLVRISVKFNLPIYKYAFNTKLLEKLLNTGAQTIGTLSFFGNPTSYELKVPNSSVVIEYNYGTLTYTDKETAQKINNALQKRVKEKSL